MKRLIRILAAVLGLGAAAPAIAADMPVKAGVVPYMPVCTIQQCTGFYLGGHVEGSGSNADILGSGINGSIFSNGAGLGLHAGYQLWNGNFFAAAEIGGTYDVGGTSFIGSIADVKPWSVEYLAKFGIGLQNLFNSGPAAPSQGPVSIIQALNASLVSPYFLVGGRTRNFGTGLVTGAGAEYTIGGGWNAYAEYLHVNYNQTAGGTATDANGNLIGPVSIGTENVVRAGINRKF